MHIAIEPQVPGEEAGIERACEIEIALGRRTPLDLHHGDAVEIGARHFDHIDGNQGRAGAAAEDLEEIRHAVRSRPQDCIDRQVAAIAGI